MIGAALSIISHSLLVSAEPLDQRAHLGEEGMNDPPTAFRIEGSAMATGAGLGVTANLFAGFGQPLTPIAELTQGGSPEACQPTSG